GTSTTPNAIIDVYLGSNCNGDYTTNIKSKQYLASTTADASGTWSVNLSSVTCFLNGEYLTATATNPTNGSTGPFASGLLVTLPTPAVYYPPGTYTVGPTGTFCTLKGVANFLNLFTISGAYIFELQPTYNGSTEATPIVFNNNAGSSASNTVTIRPAAGAVNLLIGNGNADNTIRLNGMDFLTIDGRAGGTGTSRNLSIETFNNLGAAIMLRNDAINNSIRFCNVRGGAAYTGAGGSSGGMIGIIEINTLAGSTTGCDNNTIANCLIANNNSSTLSPISGIYCRGLSTTATNNNIVIRNNEFNGIREYGYNGANKYSGIIHFDAFNSAAVIEGNSIYQSTAYNIPLQSSSQIVTQYGIFVHNGSGYSISAANVTNLTGNGNNFIIRDNFIGGSGPNCSGTWTVNAPTSSSGQYRFIGIYVQGHSSIPSGNLATIEGNTIKNIAWGTTAAFSNIAPQLAVWGGIVVVGGQTAATAGHSVIIGSASKPNIIGDNLINGSITVTNAGTVAGNGMNIVGVQVQGMGSGNATIEYNQIGGITASGITGVGRVSTIEGIRVDDGNNIIRYNTIGSTTQANSFNITASATTYSATAANNQIQRVRGIVHSGGTATTASTTIANNTIANLRMNYAATATGPGAARGIVFDNPTPANVRGAIQIQNNTIFNLTSNQNFAASGATANVVGIDFNLSGNTEAANTDISGNTIYGLTTNGSTVITNALGIYYSGRSAGTQTINGNFIRDFASNNINQSQTAIEAAGGVATYSNNIIYLGNAITTHNVLNGISETGGTNQFYFNTSTIGGTATATGANNTFAFTTTVNTGTRNIRNNIFFNARSNSAGTSKHYAISLPGNTGLTINNNNYFVSGTGGVLGRYNAVDNATLGAWQTSTTQDAASQSINPAFTANIANGTGTSTATNYRPTGTGIIAGVAVASVTTDYSGTYRSCNNTLGAFEIAPTAPNLQITNPAAVCSPNTVNLNAVGVITDLNSTSGTTSYFTTLANAISNTSPIAITTAVSASGTYFIRKTA
ncbi:MAG: beta strand repeat-containing protein, partial [Bacteroidia bacterium]